LAEIINNEKVFSLLEVTNSIEKTLNNRYKHSFWVKADMIKLNHYLHSGHAYPDLVEKKDGKVVAQIRSTFWSSRFQETNFKFLQITKEPLKDGISIMFRAEVKFNPLHGLSLNILEIDPSFTLGELEREKQETLKRLEEENIIHKNQNLKLPLLPQRIAIISVETSKGFADFIDVIDNNSWNYCFFHMLFPSLLQGDNAVESIINQLNNINKVKHHFDVVAIIRGGGGDVGLSCYNNYKLSREVALFPLPVLSGIGHSTNQTVVEMISHKNSITPTKLAELLIQEFHNFSVPLRENERKIIDYSASLLKDKNKELHESVKYFQWVTQSNLLKNQSTISDLSNKLIRLSEIRLTEENKQLSNVRNKFKLLAISLLQSNKETFQNTLSVLDKSTRKITQKAYLSIGQLLTSIKMMPFNIIKNKNEHLENKKQILSKSLNRFMENEKTKLVDKKNIVNLLDPKNVLERGYSITYVNGKAIHQSSEINKGDTIETQLFNGKLQSIVKSTNLIKWKKKKHIRKPSKNYKK
jgi:exodeoxyribonuclease VII large subunit